MENHDHEHDHDHGHDHSNQGSLDELIKISTLTLIKIWLSKKIGFTTKEPVDENNPLAPVNPPAGIEINTIAIVLDGEVQEVIRTQNRMAALMLSEPKFVDISALPTKPTIGWLYDGKTFRKPE